MDFSYLGNRLSKDIEGELSKYLPDYPDIGSLAWIVANTVITEVEKNGSNILPMDGIDPEIYLLLLAREYSKKISERVFKLKNEAKGFFQSNYKILLLVGAGLSYEAGMPLTRQLKAILKAIGIKTTDDRNLNEAFKTVKTNPSLDIEFKKRFRNLINQKVCENSSYTLIAQKFLDGSMQEIFCLNWDNLIEQSYNKLNGSYPIKKISSEDDCPQINDSFIHALWKLNGDVDEIDTTWIYPGENGRVFNGLDKYLNFLFKQTEKTFISLAVGYSESDENINNSIVTRIEDHSAFFRIGMDMRLFNKYENYFLVSAQWILPQLL